MVRKSKSTATIARARATERPLDIIKLGSKFLLIVFLAGGGYLFSVNQNAVRGYQIRNLEKEISQLRDQNAELKIAEADLRSLYRIEAIGADLKMEKLEEVRYLDEPSFSYGSDEESEWLLSSLTQPSK